jgi:hypothetical protein
VRLKTGLYFDDAVNAVRTDAFAWLPLLFIEELQMRGIVDRGKMSEGLGKVKSIPGFAGGDLTYACGVRKPAIFRRLHHSRDKGWIG